jgi:hypothetical protein
MIDERGLKIGEDRGRAGSGSEISNLQSAIINSA